MGKKAIAWTDQAKADLRAIDQSTALRILHSLAHYLVSGEGDVKRLRTSSRRNCGCASGTTVCAFTTMANPSVFWRSSIGGKHIVDGTLAHAASPVS